MKRYQVAPGFKFTLVIFIFSLCFLISFLVEVIRFHFPVEVNAFNLGILRNKQYVSVTARKCTTYPYNDGQKYRNYSHVYLDLAKEYNIYHLLIGNDIYLTVGVCEKSMKDALEAWPFGNGTEPVTILGRVVRSSDDEMNVLQVNAQEVRTKNSTLAFIGGISMCISGFMFFSFAGIRKVYVKPFEDSKRYKDFYLGRAYRMEEEMMREEKNLKQLMEKQVLERSNMKKYALGIIGSLAVFLFCGYLYIFGDSGTVFLSTVALYVMFAMLFVFLLMSKLFWQSFVNTDYPMAYRISDLFLLRTNSIKREEASKIIAVIRNRLSSGPEEEKKEEENVLMWYGPGVWELPAGNNSDGGDEHESNAAE